MLGDAFKQAGISSKDFKKTKKIEDKKVVKKVKPIVQTKTKVNFNFKNSIWS